MKTKEIMPGVEEIGSSVIRDTLAQAVEIANAVKRIPSKSASLAITLFRAGRDFHGLLVEIDKLQKCAVLAKEFKVVKRDPQPVKRKGFVANRNSFVNGHPVMSEYEIACPLAWSCKLPAPRVSSMRETIHGLELESRVPPPPPAAVEQLRKHAKKFDRTEVWWVPKDILVVRPVSPDPIVVGVITTSTLGDFCFELHRWIDEDYEDSYWSKEGY
jgi:hypothetical protein